MSTTWITNHLWVSQSAFAATNAGVFLVGRHACLIDPGVLPAEIGRIQRFLAERNVAPESLILTHSHWDHIFGPEHFPGVKTIAQASYLDEIHQEMGDHIKRQVAQWEAENDIQRPAGRPFRIPIPTATFEDIETLTVGESEALRLVHAPGHAADQLVAYHAPTALLWASDILSDLEIPFISHNLAAFEKTLDELSDWDIQVLVPGHGNPTDSPDDVRGRFAHDRAYLAEIRERVTIAVDKGHSVEEAVAVCRDMRFRRPEENRGSHQLNVESVYLELGGEADPAAVGWGQLGGE